MILKHLICLGFVLLAFNPISARAEIKTFKDISYGDLTAEKLDIYSPPLPKKAPVIIYVHGGGWHVGKKSAVHSKDEAFTDEGMIFISIEYPMLPQHPVKQQAQSVANAIGWIYKNISKYGGDPDTIYISGHSAGAHLVSLVGTDVTYLKAVGLSPNILSGVIPIDSAALNIPWRMQNLKYDPKIVKKMFSLTFGDDPSQWETYSPTHAINGQTPPPFLLFRASNRPLTQAAYDSFIKAVKAAGGYAEFHVIPNTTHETINKEIGIENNKTFDYILDFIEQTH